MPTVVRMRGVGRARFGGDRAGVGTSPRAPTVPEFISSQFMDAVPRSPVCRAARAVHGFRFTSDIMNLDKMTVFFKKKGKSLEVKPF